MTVENISRSVSKKESCRFRWGSNPRPSDGQSDAHPTEPPARNNACMPLLWNCGCLYIDTFRAQVSDSGPLGLLALK